ncbi:MAG: nuclear transport factor 2 family protein [Terriglobales bacterium]|jgi:ketosteroid isomerase-like protein
MRIAKLVVVSVLCLSTGGLIAGQSSREDLAVEKRITDTLHQMYEAEKRKDLRFVLSHLADDFAEVAGDGGLYHRADIQAGWPDVVLRDYQVSNCVFKLMARDSAYLTCKLEVDATYKGQPFPKRFQLTTVWTRHKDDWLIRFEQGTIIPEPSLPEASKNGQGKQN